MSESKSREITDKLALLYNHLSHQFPCDETALDMLKDIINNHSQQSAEDKWISVEERLPERYQHIWQMRDLGDHVIIEDNYWQYEDEKYYKKNNITHWMPIVKPNPPKSN